MRESELNALESSIKSRAAGISKELRTFFREHYQDYDKNTRQGEQFDSLLRLIEYIATLRPEEVRPQIAVVLKCGGAEGYKASIMRELEVLSRSDSATLKSIISSAEKVFLDYGKLIMGALDLMRNPSPPHSPPVPPAGAADSAADDEKGSPPYNKFT